MVRDQLGTLDVRVNREHLFLLLKCSKDHVGEEASCFGERLKWREASWWRRLSLLALHERLKEWRLTVTWWETHKGSSPAAGLTHCLQWFNGSHALLGLKDGHCSDPERRKWCEVRSRNEFSKGGLGTSKLNSFIHLFIFLNYFYYIFNGLFKHILRCISFSELYWKEAGRHFCPTYRGLMIMHSWEQQWEVEW